MDVAERESKKAIKKARREQHERALEQKQNGGALKRISTNEILLQNLKNTNTKARLKPIDGGALSS